MTFARSIVLVTGAASGIGWATARLLDEAGAARLILVDRDGDRLARAAQALRCETLCITGNVADEALWSRHALDLEGLSHAVINAGIADASPIIDTSFAQWRRVMTVNLDGAFLSLQAAMRAMAERGGAITLCASASGLKAEVGTAAYGASKAAVLHLTKVAAKEGATHRIRVNVIAPGGVITDIWQSAPGFSDLVAAHGEEQAFAQMGSGMPLGRFASADEIARQINFLLSDEAATITGATLTSDSGYLL